MIEDDEQYAVRRVDRRRHHRRALGRGLLTRANHATLDDLPAKLRAEPLKFDAPQLLTAPPCSRRRLLNRLTRRALQRVLVPQGAQRRTGASRPSPVLPPARRGRRLEPGLRDARVPAVPVRGAARRASDVIRAVLERIAARAPGVGAQRAQAVRPGQPRRRCRSRMPGWTLALDIPIGPGLGALLDELDELVLAAGGRLYLAKDSRTTPADHPPRYPRLDEWRKVRDAVDPRRRVRLGHVPHDWSSTGTDDRRRRQPPVHPAARRHLATSAWPRWRRSRPTGRCGWCWPGARRRGSTRPRPGSRRAGCAVETVAVRRPRRGARRGGRQGVRGRRHRRRAPGVRAARRPGEGLDRRRHRRRVGAGQLHRGGRRRGRARRERMRTQGHGTIVALSSVAGERARRSNFVYGSTKAGLDAFFSGLGEALRRVRRARHGRAPRVRAHADDRGPQARAAVDHARGGRRRWSSTPCAPARSWCGRPRRCGS